MNDGVITRINDRSGEQDKITAKREAITDKPLVILINGKTSSGAEMFASALKENNRATLIGSKTLGVNSILSVHQITGGSLIAVTIAKMITPNGLDISGKGITPNIEIPLSKPAWEEILKKNQKATESDPQYLKSLEILKSKLK